MAMQRAPRVCATCKARKKGCDKALPICGYCSKRKLPCSYPNSLFSSPPPFSSSFTSLSSLENSLQLNVHKILHKSDRPFPEVCSKYFENFHRWLPVVSQELLLRALTTHLEDYPPIDLSMLVLAIYLVTMNPSEDKEISPISPENFYLDLRILMTKSQVILPASKYLAQATIIVSAYEFACGKPHNAYVSIGTCTRILSILGLDELESRKSSTISESVADLEILENQNLCWGLLVLERLVANECPSYHLKPAIKLPSFDSQLPSDLVPNSFVHSPSNRNEGGIECAPTVGDFQSPKIGPFGRQIQAIFFLNQVLDATSGESQVPISSILKLDEKLWNFLGILMDQSPQRHYCGANGTVVRSLVRLHHYLLRQSSLPGTADTKIQEQSHTALDTLSRMMIEVAHDHLARFVPGQIDSLPLSCSYNIRSMIDLIKDRWRDFGDYEPFHGLEAFAALEKAISERWKSSSDHEIVPAFKKS